jgi:hypothetical protein
MPVVTTGVLVVVTVVGVVCVGVTEVAGLMPVKPVPLEAEAEGTALVVMTGPAPAPASPPPHPTSDVQQTSATRLVFRARNSKEIANGRRSADR